jgi:NAD(P)-dependent dehydrogenase (short-subunit alcohol dehydrogenase family)
LNVVVPLRLNRAAAENLIARVSGTIVNIASVLAPADQILNQTVLVRLRNHNHEGMDHDSIRTS